MTVPSVDFMSSGVSAFAMPNECAKRKSCENYSPLAHAHEWRLPLQPGSTFRFRPDIQFLTSASEKSGWFHRSLRRKRDGQSFRANAGIQIRSTRASQRLAGAIPVYSSDRHLLQGFTAAAFNVWCAGAPDYVHHRGQGDWVVSSGVSLNPLVSSHIETTGRELETTEMVLPPSMEGSSHTCRTR
jgi:hypothetical protein